MIGNDFNDNAGMIVIPDTGTWVMYRSPREAVRERILKQADEEARRFRENPL